MGYRLLIAESNFCGTNYTQKIRTADYHGSARVGIGNFAMGVGRTWSLVTETVAGLG